MIACSTVGWIGELGKLFAGHDREVFWSYTVSHCFELMLMRIMKMHSFEDVLDKVKNVWEFINNNPLALKIFRFHSSEEDITVISSEFEFLKPYLTLESIFNAKKSLKSMSASSDWFVGEGTAIFNLINDSTFWETVERVMKYTSPLVHGLLLFSTLESQHVGYIYDTMDGIKETIAKGFNHKNIDYKTVWEVIDDVWSTQLYNPLHAVGYFLKLSTQLISIWIQKFPLAFYSLWFMWLENVTFKSRFPYSLISTDSVKIALTRPVKLIKSLESLQLSGGLKRQMSTQNCRVLLLKF